MHWRSKPELVRLGIPEWHVRAESTMKYVMISLSGLAVDAMVRIRCEDRSHSNCCVVVAAAVVGLKQCVRSVCLLPLSPSPGRGGRRRSASRTMADQDGTTRINVWSTPRTLSTALMYSFAQRSDTKVRTGGRRLPVFFAHRGSRWHRALAESRPMSASTKGTVSAVTILNIAGPG